MDHTRASGSWLGAVAAALGLSLVVLQPGVALVARQGFADLPGVRLWLTDSGGSGEPVVLLHPNTGTSEIWEPQINPALLKLALFTPGPLACVYA
jgi:hypothetical protein